MWPIFNKKVTEKYNLWDYEQCMDALFPVDKVYYCGLNQKKKKKREKRSAKRRRKNNWVCLDWAYFYWNWKLKLKTL